MSSKKKAESSGVSVQSGAVDKSKLSTKKVVVLIDPRKVHPRDMMKLYQWLEKDREYEIVRNDMFVRNGNSVPESWTEEFINQEKIVRRFNKLNKDGGTNLLLAIDAMDILLSGKVPVDAFCIVSVRGDYGYLVEEIKKHNKKVYGFGKNKESAAETFRKACNEFHYFKDMKDASE